MYSKKFNVLFFNIRLTRHIFYLDVGYDQSIITIYGYPIFSLGVILFLNPGAL